MDDVKWSRVSQQPTVFEAMCTFERCFGREIFDFEEVGSDADGGQGEDFDFLSPTEFCHPMANTVNSNHLPWGNRGIAWGELSILMGATFQTLA